MNSSLFAPDHHARDMPAQSPAPQDRQELIARLVHTNYSALGVPPDAPVFTIEAANLNSANYRVGDYCFKLMNAPADAASLLLLPEIADRVRALGLPAAEFLRTDDGARIGTAALDEKKVCFYLQPFLAGTYYSGRSIEFDAILRLLTRFAEAPLTGLAIGIQQAEPYRSWRPHALAAAIANALNQRRAGVMSEFDRKAEAAIETLGPYAEQADALVQNMHVEGLAHFDLHPHNLLFRNDELLAVLDLESFRQAPMETAIGFALFKLGRKAIAAGHLTLLEFRAQASARFELPRLRPYVMAEITRRVYSILNQHYLLGRPGWNADLGSHLRGLDEARQMFA